jgi:hypothetical protein
MRQTCAIISSRSKRTSSHEPRHRDVANLRSNDRTVRGMAVQIRNEYNETYELCPNEVLKLVESLHKEKAYMDVPRGRARKELEWHRIRRRRPPL